VIGLDSAGRVDFMNRAARGMLGIDAEGPQHADLALVVPEFGPLLDRLRAEEGAERVQEELGLARVARQERLLVRMARRISDEGALEGYVVAFDDVTDLVSAQRMAAWADVARRIAHEIKNPLTPIQLAAERLQRRYGKKVEAEDGTFAKLTDTIVRQVGDLRRMVDEFSSFARMPKPVFREESLLDIARQTLFLHEVAKPDIRFKLKHPGKLPALVCDRRQLGQALTNLVKNAVEAVEAREGDRQGLVEMAIRTGEDGQMLLDIADNGIGLPAERERIVEPYMTTRSRGTGLGLAIVKKIVEEHFGTMAFADRKGGGTVVTLCFDMATLAPLAGIAGDDDADGELNQGATPSALTRSRNGPRT
jgi:two-component system nitrogen regulation sensor histidine kinase NtrY